MEMNKGQTSDPFAIKELLNKTFKRSLERWKFFLKLLVAYIVAYGVVALVVIGTLGLTFFESIAADSVDPSTILQSSTFITFFLIAIVLVVLLVLPLQIATYIGIHQEMKFFDVIKLSYKRLLSFVGTTFLQGIIVFGLFFIPILMTFAVSAIAPKFYWVGVAISIVGAVFGMYLGLKFMFAQLAVAIDGKKTIESLKESYSLTNKVVGKVILAFILLIILFLVAGLVLAVIPASLFGEQSGITVLFNMVYNLLAQVIGTVFFYQLYIAAKRS